MHQAYNFVTGPLAWVTFIVFFGGIAFKIVQSYLLARQKDRELLYYFDLKFALRSIINWLIPFRAKAWQLNPVLTVVTFAFHLCLILVPVFLCAHVLLWKESWDISYWYLPAQLADLMTLVVIGACLFFAWRRIVNPAIKFVTTVQDWAVLLLVFIPFLTGFLAYHQIFPYLPMLILHILSAEILLMSIPFTRLSHMFFAWMTRAYIGSEFGKIRKAIDW